MADLAACKRNGVSRRRHVAVWSMVEAICSGRIYLRPMGPPARRVPAPFSLAMASRLSVGSGAAGYLLDVRTFAWTLGLGRVDDLSAAGGAPDGSQRWIAARSGNACVFSDA